MNSRDTLYLAPEDLYRVAASASPQLTKFRPGELTIVEVNGVKRVIANGKGVSLFNDHGLQLTELTGWVWEIRAGTAMPPGLKLIPDDVPPGHYTLAPISDMSIGKFVALLEDLVIHCVKKYKKRA